MIGMRSHTTRGMLALVGTMAAALLAAPLAAADQDKPVSAIVQRAMLASIVHHCSEAYPKLAPTLKAKLDVWNAEHADANTSADALIADLTPDSRTQIDRTVQVVEQTAIDMLGAARRQAAGEQFCSQAFESFGSTSDEGYYDADNLDEAMGMYYMTMKSAEVGREMCVARYPHLASHADEALAEWRVREAPIIARIESTFDRMQRENPDSARHLMEMVERNARKILSVAIDNGQETYCRKHFDDLASGEHRRATPKMYRFLEQGSSAQ